MPKLTAASIAKLKPDPKRRVEHPDAIVPGLYHVIQPSGARSWAVRYRFEGQSRKLTLSPVAPSDLAKARQLAREALHAVADGRDPVADKRRARDVSRVDATTFAGAARSFIDLYARPNNRSWKERARMLGLRPTGASYEAIPGAPVELWGDRAPSDVSKKDVLAYIDAVVARSGGTAANRTLSSIRRLYNWMLERDLVSTSPCFGLKRPAAETSRERVLTDSELRRVWKAAECLGYPFGPYVQLLILTAQRRKEVAGMSSAELEDATWSMARERTKNATAHDVPLSDLAMDILRSHPRMGGFVFSTTGTAPISGFSRAKRQLDAIIGKPPLPGWNFHDLRRTVASGLARMNVAPHVIEATLNHKSGVIRGVGAVYNRYQYAAEKREALNLWAKHVGTIINSQDL